MLSINNKTGIANDTKIYDEKGNDITTLLSCYKIDVDIAVDKAITAKLYCYIKEIDLEFVDLKENKTCDKYKIHKIHNYYEMKNNGFLRIN